MITITGTLPIGVEFAGAIHTEFELRPQLVRDTVDIFEDLAKAERAQRNSQFFAACLYAGRLTKLGDMPREHITPDLVLDMHQDDYSEIISAAERLEQQMSTFRGKAPGIAQDNSGAVEAGIQAE